MFVEFHQVSYKIKRLLCVSTNECTYRATFFPLLMLTQNVYILYILLYILYVCPRVLCKFMININIYINMQRYKKTTMLRLLYNQ